jgi:hypothetical protein
MYLRSGFTFLMYIVGALGVYKLVKKIFGVDRFSAWGAMIGSLYYALNLGAVQTFFAPLESFVVMYGLLPWAILTIGNYLENANKKNLLILFLVQIAFSVIGFIPPLFVAFGFVLLGILLGHLWSKRRSFWQAVIRVLVVGIVVLMAHVYWLMPVMRYSLSGSKSYVEAKNNQLSTPDFQYMSEARGRWSDTAILRGFFIDSSDSVLQGETVFYPIFQSWIEYLLKYEWLGNVLFGIIMLGVLGMVVSKASGAWTGGIIFSLIVGFTILTQGEELFAKVIYLMRDVPMLGQAFRAAWTKFSGILMLSYSVLIAYGIWMLVRWREWLKWIAVPVVIAAIVFFSWPIFQGEFIYERLKVNTPGEYLTLFEFMQTQEKDGRIANLPMAWNWGWGANSWGYSGSGFFWYGIEQPILDRAFDVWSPYNETFYNQFSTALYGGDKEDVKRVLTQYDVKYVLLDESVIAPGQDKKILRIEETKKIASELGWIQKFQEGFLTVWDTGLTTDRFVGAPTTYSLVDGDTIKTREDTVYRDLGTYVADNGSQAMSYPFADLMKEEVRGVEFAVDTVTFTVPTSDGQLTVPGWNAGEIVRIDFKDDKPLPAYLINGQSGPIFLGKEKPEKGQSYLVAKISEGKEWSEYLSERTFDLQGETLKVEVVGQSTIYDFAMQGNLDIKNCDVLGRGSVKKEGNTYSADGRGSVCDYVIMKELDTRLPYFMRVIGANREGRSVKFFLYNTSSERNDIEYLLDKDQFNQTFSLLPWAFDGFYALNIDVRSFGQRTENRIEKVETSYFPLEQIARARMESGEVEPRTNILSVENTKKYGTWLYIVETKNGGLLKLSQGYDEGWVSPWIRHVKVDGWANGWMVPPGEHRIAIFYWPQLLEYLGFALLGVTGIILLTKRK